ncbi:protein of unknown function [Bradyrhizobium vignae]|uniref:Uncharacterized protein n=1 Tax=Bradyrhizobium vignae TaxID=1549949 RepID=A0A2U3PXF1_9BRAD|nr:protein of unknown function [Bradyrhizobium vignae]
MKGFSLPHRHAKRTAIPSLASSVRIFPLRNSRVLESLASLKRPCRSRMQYGWPFH